MADNQEQAFTRAEAQQKIDELLAKHNVQSVEQLAQLGRKLKDKNIVFWTILYNILMEDNDGE